MKFIGTIRGIIGLPDAYWVLSYLIAAVKAGTKKILFRMMDRIILFSIQTICLNSSFAQIHFGILALGVLGLLRNDSFYSRVKNSSADYFQNSLRLREKASKVKVPLSPVAYLMIVCQVECLPGIRQIELAIVRAMLNF